MNYQGTKTLEVLMTKHRLALGIALAVICGFLAIGAARIGNQVGYVVDNPTITIAGVTVDTTETPTTNAHEAQVQWKFGTISGTYTTCTAQAKTSYDGTNYLLFGTTVALTMTTNATTAWTLIAQGPNGSTPAVTTSSPSGTVALGFGQLTKFTFACSGAYGTSAPVTVTVIYR